MLERLVRAYSGADGVDKSSLSRLLSSIDATTAGAVPVASPLINAPNALQQTSVMDSDDDGETLHDAEATQSICEYSLHLLLT